MALRAVSDRVCPAIVDGHCVGIDVSLDRTGPAHLVHQLQVAELE